ncbi:MAG: DUF3086 domain-containing protein [Cyanobacteria bacterium P01_H01_bin.15]
MAQNPEDAMSPSPSEDSGGSSDDSAELSNSRSSHRADKGEENLALFEQQHQALQEEIAALKRQKQALANQVSHIQDNLGRLVEEGLTELQKRKQDLQQAVEQLERRKERVEAEMRTTFAGVSQEMAIRLQGFREYLVGGLQDLAAAAEQLELPTTQDWDAPSSREPAVKPLPEERPQPLFAQQQTFKDQTSQIRRILEQYRLQPDYYGPPWQLRRTFEPMQAERTEQWFFEQAGRGAVRSLGSRLQNILVASAVMSVLSQLYGDRCRTLILADTPEQLGEWRRSLQDCLGISRSDFGPNKGVGLYETSAALVKRGERLRQNNYLPLVVVDRAEEEISLALLQYPLLLAFVPSPEERAAYFY